MIVGRELELATLNACLEQMLSGQGSVLFLTGEAGLGKTTLVHEWWNGARGSSPPNGVWASSPQSLSTNLEAQASIPQHHLANPDWRAGTPALLLESACSIPIGNEDVGRLEALQPWADVIAQLQALDESPKAKKLDLKKLVHDAAPSWAWAIPFVGDIAHAALETSRLVREQKGEIDHSHEAHTQQQVFQQYVNLLTKVAEDVPLVIFLDDLHWADTSSCNLLFYLSRQISDKHILVIATYRHDDAMQAQGGKGHAIITVKNEILRYECGRELALEVLGRNAIRLLLQAMFPGYSPDDRFETWLRKISDGNSLFVTQYLKTLRDDGYLDAHGAFTGDYANITIPPTALAVVEERTRRLDEATRKLLMYATAEGEEFTSHILEQLSQYKPMELLDRLHVAAQQGLIREKGRTRVLANKTTALFGFSHALFHKALYDQLFDAQKELLHRQCYELLLAEWNRLAETNQRTTTLGTKLLTHAEKCEEWQTAADVAFTLARESSANAANDEALAMCEKCIEYSARIPNDALQAEVGYQKGIIYHQSSSYDEAAATLEAARLAFERLGIADQAVAAMNAQAWAEFRRGRYQKAEALASESLRRARESGYARGEASALNALGSVYATLGDSVRALDCYGRCLILNEANDDVHGQASCLNNIGTVHYSQGAYSVALDYKTRSLALLQTTGDRPGEALVLHGIGSIHHAVGENNLALEYLLRSLAIHEAYGDRSGQAMCLNGIGNVYSAAGDTTRALEYLNRSADIRDAVVDPLGLAAALSNIGHVYYNLGDFRRSLEYQTRSMEIQEAIGYRQGLALTMVNIGANHAALGDYPAARAALEKGLTIAEELGARIIIGGACGELGRLIELELPALTGDARTSHLREVLGFFQRAVEIYRDTNHEELKPYEADLERVRGLLGGDRGFQNVD